MEKEVITWTDEKGLFDAKTLAEKVCKYANFKIISLCYSCGIEPTFDRIKEYTLNIDSMRQEYISMQRESIGNSLLADAIEDVIIEKFNQMLHAYDKMRINIDGNESDAFEFIIFNDGKLFVNTEALTKRFVHKLSDEFRDRYDKHLKACEALNDFMNGYQEAFAQCFLFDPKTNRLYPNLKIRYDIIDAGRK